MLIAYKLTGENGAALLVITAAAVGEQVTQLMLLLRANGKLMNQLFSFQLTNNRVKTAETHLFCL